MKTIAALAATLFAAALAVLPVTAAITRDGSASWPSSAAPGCFDASGSAKLVVVVSGEHNFPNNLTGKCNGVTYNGQPLVQAAQQLPSNPATGGHGQTHASIWYLDNPGGFPGSGTIAVSCTGTSWVATAIGLSGTLPGIGPVAKVSGAAAVDLGTTASGSMVVAAVGMGGQGNTASPLPGVTASSPAQAVTIAALKTGSSWAGHAVACATSATPFAQTYAFNTAKTDLVTIVAAFLPVPVPITRTGSVSWLASAAPGSFDASGSAKLVVVVSGEHNFANNLTGTCNGVTYNSQSLVQAVYQAPGGHGQTHASIWYLDNPGNFPGSGTIAVTCTGTSWVATAFGLSGTLPGVGPVAQISGAAAVDLATADYGSLVIAAVGMGGQGNTASPLPGVIAASPAQAATIAALKIGSDWAGHAVSGTTIDIPVMETFSFNTAKADLVTVAAAFPAACPVIPTSPGPVVVDLVPGQSVQLTWANLLPHTGANVWVEVWIGPDPAHLERVIAPAPGGLNLTSGSYTAAAPGTYYARIDSYLDGSPTGTPVTGQVFAFEVSGTGLLAETWLGLRPLATLLTLQREGIAAGPPDRAWRLATAAIDNLAAPCGTRLRGLLTPATTGWHILHIAGSENAALWLSADDSRFHKQRAAWHLESTGPAEWDRFPTQTSAPVYLTAGVAYYLEAQVMNSTGIGHLALGWTPPGAAAPALIPADRLTCPPADPDDTNDNSLPDSFEQSSGLSVSALPGAASESGDPDRDGISNFDEYRGGTDPLATTELPLGLTRETWTSPGVSGYPLTSLTSNPRFADLPNEIIHVPGIDDANRGTHYGARYRGFLIAPATGSYRFWITGNDEVQLWLADGTVAPLGDPAPRAARTDRFGKRLVAWNDYILHNYAWPTSHDFDYTGGQRSQLIQLTQGQPYYLEVLHKQGWGAGDDHVSLAWQPPGQAREIVPATAFIADIPHDADLGNDNLPDAWQANNGLADPALTPVHRGQFGDPDGDGLINLLEYQQGTNPRNPDTDGDGLTDRDERDRYHTNPLVSNTVQPGPLTPLPVQQYADTTLRWSRDAAGTLTAIDRRGEISYSFQISADAADRAALQPGILEVALTAAAAGIPRASENLPLGFSIDGARFAAVTLTSLAGAPATATVLTPWLTAGPHTLTILHDNYRAELALRIHSLTLRNLGGEDLTQNGSPDWLDQRLATENRLTRIPATSLTSPVCIEGITTFLPGLTLTAGATAVPAAESIDSGFFAEVPLDETGAAVALTATFQSGAITETRPITWAPTDLSTLDVLHLRQGDSLRLDASDPAHAISSYTVQFNGTLLAGPDNVTTHPTGQPFKATFDTPGTHPLTVTFPDDTTHTTILTVHAAAFGPALSVRANFARAWQPAAIGQDATVQPDSHLAWQETTAPGAALRAFRVNSTATGERHVIARLPEEITGAPGAILACGTVNTFYLAYLDETTDLALISTYPDGTRLMRGSIVAVGLPPDVAIRIRTHYQGTVFLDGSDTLWLTAADFDQNGIANLYFEWAGQGDPYACTFVDLFTTTPPP
jgi:hypothetical protein